MAFEKKRNSFEYFEPNAVVWGMTMGLEVVLCRVEDVCIFIKAEETILRYVLRPIDPNIRLPLFDQVVFSREEEAKAERARRIAVWRDQIT